MSLLSLKFFQEPHGLAVEIEVHAINIPTNSSLQYWLKKRFLKPLQIQKVTIYPSINPKIGCTTSLT